MHVLKRLIKKIYLNKINIKNKEGRKDILFSFLFALVPSPTFFSLPIIWFLLKTNNLLLKTQPIP